MKKSGVYLISNGQGQVKIGKFSGDPCRRLRELQTASAYKLTLLCYVYYPNAIRMEQSLQRKHRRLRIQGEWFEHSLEISLPEPPDLKSVGICGRAHRWGRVCALCDPRKSPAPVAAIPAPVAAIYTPPWAAPTNVAALAASKALRRKVGAFVINLFNPFKRTTTQ